MARIKVTLRAEEKLVKRAKELARQQQTSLSAMFEGYLESWIRNHDGNQEIGPLTRQMTGLAKVPEGKSDRELIEEALAEKYGLP